MQRRTFLYRSLLASAALGLPLTGCQRGNEPTGNTAAGSDGQSFAALATYLLRTWGDGMLARQIDTPDDPSRHGALECPACSHIHGRCMDAVYPFTHLAATTGEEKYLTAAIRVMEWAEHNVSQADGSWTVMPDPKTWRGISVFGAIALAETLHYHADMLPPAIRKQWTNRLRRVAEYIHQNFDLTFTNINYGFTALHCLYLAGEVLEDQKYGARARVLAKDAKQWFTQPNALLFGEGKPSDARSAKGLPAVDLGYNVEESLNGVVQYALWAADEELLTLLEKSLASHLEFMLPDGGWDNSWGTRQYKWSYWGSRTTDGSQPAYALLAERNPAFGTAARRTTELLKRCTSESGLLYGGLHFAEHGLPPCIHHTFAHAKPLASLLDMAITLPDHPQTPLPRTVADGVTHFPELDVWLLARGPWRATVSAYDFIYKKHVFQGMGGALTMLYHEKAGPLLAASMANYELVEAYNQQPDPDGEDFALTPRLENRNGGWFTNLFDLEATVTSEDHKENIVVQSLVKLVDHDGFSPSQDNSGFRFDYLISPEQVTISARANEANALEGTELVVPVIASVHEECTRLSDESYAIRKPGCRLIIEADAPLTVRETLRDRVFNMVPGVQAVPFVVVIPAGSGKTVTVSLRMEND